MELVWRGNNTIAKYPTKYRKPFQLMQMNTLSVSSYLVNEKSYIGRNWIYVKNKFQIHMSLIQCYCL